MEQKQNCQMEVIIEALRCCGTQNCKICPLYHHSLEDCDAMNLQAADLLEKMSNLLRSILT